MSQPTHSDDPRDTVRSFARHRSWSTRFLSAGRGIVQGIQGQATFRVHFLAALIVVIAAIWMRASASHWCLLILCMGAVLTAELFNSALEWVCRSITDQYDDRIYRALNIASGAVLLASATSALVGSLVFLDLLIFSSW